MNIRRFSVAAVFAAGASIAAANTVYVDGGLGDYDGHDGSSWELALPRIQDGIKHATEGGTVVVRSGTYADWDNDDAKDNNGVQNCVYITKTCI